MTPQQTPPAPLPLPRFTFLCGPQPTLDIRKALTEALCSRDSGLLMCDFEEPLRSATVHLFYSGMTMEHDLTDPAERVISPILTFPINATIEEWLSNLSSLLVDCYGPGAIGEIALRDYLSEGTDMLFNRVIFRDVESPADVEVFADRFPGECLCIHFGTQMRAHEEKYGSQVRHIWLPVESPSIDLAIETIERELQS